MKFTHFVLKKRSFATFVLLVMLISSLQPVQGSWSDNFDDKDLSDWDQFTESSTSPSWDASNGELHSGLGPLEINYLCQNSDFKYGTVTVDLYYVPTLRSAVVYIGRNNENADSMFLEVSGSLGSPHPNTVGFIHRFITDTNVYNVPMADLDVTGWHTYSIVRYETKAEVYLDETLIITADLGEIIDTDYTQFCLSAWQDDTTTFDNLIVRDEGDNLGLSSDQTLQYILFALGGLTIIGIGVFYTNRYMKKKRQSRLTAKRNVVSNLKRTTELDDQSILSLILSTKKVNKEDINKDFQKYLPIDLLKYRFIMHPVRLTMMKMLYIEPNMSSTEIKHLLDISWGVYATHINSLKDRGFITTDEKFDEDGALTNFVQLTPTGQSEYEDVLNLLRNFIDHDSIFDALISGDEKELFRDDLYPS